LIANIVLPNHIFRQEYLAEFLDNSSGLFSNVRECIKEPIHTSKYFGGLDIGRADDYTVLTIINDQKQIVYCERWRQDEWSRIINKVGQKINEYDVK